MTRLIVVLIATLAGVAPLLAGGEEEPPANIAIGGYDPVAYFTLGEAMRGSEEVALAYGNRLWYFATAEHRALFEENPEAFLPWFGEYCANGLSDRHVINADPEHWLIDEGRLFLFFSARGRRTWIDGDLDEEFRQATAYYREVFGTSATPGEPSGYR